MALARIQGGTKEIAQINRKEHKVFDLEDDPRELQNLNGAGYQPSEELQGWIEHVETALSSAEVPAVKLNEEDIEKLKALGYVDH